MKRTIMFIFCILLIISFAGCKKSDDNSSNQVKASSKIPTNVSTNLAWGGGMCEAKDYIYYVSGSKHKEKITRINKDGKNPKSVTGEYYYISQLTVESNNIYFVATPEDFEKDTLYKLPLDGGKEQKVIDGQIKDLQSVKGKLYWKDYYVASGEIKEDQTTDIQIKCVNSDGSDLKTLFKLNVSEANEVPFDFLATEGGIYYATSGNESNNYDIYRMDLSGKNIIKLNNNNLEKVDELFYDQGKIYFLMQQSSSTDPFQESVMTIDAKGNIKTVIKDIGYFPQDFGCVAYCGISNGIFYYFDFLTTNGSSEHLLMDLHQFDISKKTDSVILHNVDLGDKAVGTISSIRGKSIKGAAMDGLYILGNDIYFSPFKLV